MKAASQPPRARSDRTAKTLLRFQPKGHLNNTRYNSYIYEFVGTGFRYGRRTADLPSSPRVSYMRQPHLPSPFTTDDGGPFATACRDKTSAVSRVAPQWCLGGTRARCIVNVMVIIIIIIVAIFAAIFFGDAAIPGAAIGRRTGRDSGRQNPQVPLLPRRSVWREVTGVAVSHVQETREQAVRREGPLETRGGPRYRGRSGRRSRSRSWPPHSR